MRVVDQRESIAAPPLTHRWVERAVVFDCAGDQLVGVLTCPEAAHRRGIVVVVGGPQYRAGSHRQFTHLARALAGSGYPVLRFDVRGMGDSSGTPGGFESIDADIEAALSAFHNEMPGVDDFILWGLCDGASAAMMFAAGGGRVNGIVAVNPWVRTDATLARSHMRLYYPRRIMQREFWVNLLSGRVHVARALRSLLANVSAAKSRPTARPSFIERMQRGIEASPGPLLLVLSGNDLTAREFVEVAERPEWRRTLSGTQVARVDIPDADHTFSRLKARLAVEHATLTWLASW